MPLKTWHFFEGALQQKTATYGLSAPEKSKFLSIGANELMTIQNQFPEDFEILAKYLSSGAESPNVEEEDLDVDFEDLFKGSVEQKSWQFSFPIVRQNDQMDCAPACLAMLSEFFGRKLSLHFWRSRLSTDREGTSLYDLAVTTGKNGFISHCLELKRLEDVDSYMVPFIILRKYHYMVVYKIKKTTAIVGDPAYGLREMSLSELHEGLEPIGLFLKPNADFLTHEDSPSPWLHYVKLFRGLEKEFTIAFACSLLGVLFSIVPALISQFALDEVLAQKDLDMLWFVLGACVGVTIISNLINWAKGYYFIYIMNKFNFRSTSIFVQKLFSLPYTFFSSRHVGDFTLRLTELSQLRSFVTGTLFSVVMNLLSLFFYAAVLLLMSYEIGLFTLATIPIMVAIPVLFSRRLDRHYQNIFTKSSEQSSFMTDLIEGISVLKTAGAETSSRLRFENHLLDLIKSQNSFAMTSIGINTASQTYLQGVQFMIMGVSVYLGISGKLSAGQVISVSLIANQMFLPLQSLTSQWDQFVRLKSILSRLNDVFLAPSEKAISKPGPTHRGARLRGEIEFKNVWFRYGAEGSDWVLKNLNFRIEPGQKIAIVGPSGSGKSTIAGLLSRIYEPTEGQIFIDGRDYREFELGWLRNQIGLLQQDNRLFSGRLFENVALSELDAKEDDLYAAANNASATDLVGKKSHGWQHHVPHGGIGFSGGEKQKISLMRLFYKNPSLIILDEATSALDGISEREVIQNIETVLKNNTVINIAHRYSTVKYSDCALVLKDGRIVGFGSLEQLQNTNPTFRALFDLVASDTNISHSPSEDNSDEEDRRAG